MSDLSGGDSAAAECRSLRRVIRPRRLVDDALDDDDLNMDVAGHAGQELGDEVVDGSNGQADGIALSAGVEWCLWCAAATVDWWPPG